MTNTFMDFMTNNGGILFSLLGAGLATALAGIGSARGIATVGQAASGLITEEPEKFGKTFILVSLPGTQGLYGFVIAILILLNNGILGGAAPDFKMGFAYFIAALPIAIAGYSSAIWQGKVAATGISILAKKPEHAMKGVIYAVFVEFYALLGFVASLLMVLFVK
jgi:V/A-type H+-transporting ATPase subunit K